jgi:hypothetical protein
MMAVAVLVALVAPLAAIISDAAPAGASLASDESSLLDQLNGYRQSNGRGYLARDPRADDVARAWARTMASRGALSHNPDLGGQVTRQVVSGWSRVGENVADQATAAGVFTLFVNSPSHRSLMLADFNRVGIGAARDGGGKLWVSMIFVKGPAFTAASETWKPFGTVYQLVQQQYLDFLNRGPDQDGGSYWQQQLFNGTMAPSALIKALFTSPEFAGTGGGVVRLQLAYFRRIPDYATFTTWFNRLRNGGSLDDASESFATSSDFTKTYGGTNNAAYVDAAYRNVLGRASDSAGRSSWIGKLDRSEVSRADVLLTLSESAENRRNRDPDVLVSMTYIGMLRRAPDQGGFDYWTRAVRGGTSIQSLVDQFFRSAEYRARF